MIGGHLIALHNGTDLRQFISNWAPLPAIRNAKLRKSVIYEKKLVAGKCLNQLLNEKPTNVYGHVAVVHEHVWRTHCSVCATGARVAHPVPCNS